MSTTIVYRLFFISSHCLFTFLGWFYHILVYINKKFHEFYHEFLPVSEKSKHLRKQLHRISKKPKHLTVLLGPEEPFLKDLANLVIWCVAAEISFISFYDYKGRLKMKEEELQFEVNKRKENDVHVVWHSGSGIPYKNGYVGRRIHVKIVTEIDGKKSLANLTKTFASKKIRNLSVEIVNESLQKQFEFPDPDMGLVCRKIFCLYDYPPWQIRVTEFFKIDSLRDITCATFLEQLARFSRSEQRFGK